MFSGLSLGRRRTGWAAAAAVAVGTAITIVAINGASASHAGDSIGLSATNGTKTISFKGGTPAALTLAKDTATDGAWSPDGSRMAFVNQNGAIETVRYNSATDTGMYAPADGDSRSRPTWTDDGTFLLWSANVTDTNGTHDMIEFGTGDGQGWNTINLPAGTNWTYPDGGWHDDPGAGPGRQRPAQHLLDRRVEPVRRHGRPDAVASNASSPAAGPIDNSVAFIASDGSHAQVWVFKPDTTAPRPGDLGRCRSLEPDLVPDGDTIAFDEGTNGLHRAGRWQPEGDAGSGEPRPASPLTSRPSRTSTSGSPAATAMGPRSTCHRATGPTPALTTA